MRIRPVNMEFLYGTAFLSQSPEAYERLILDAMRGDATLFTRDDEVEAQWRDHRPDPRGVGRGRRRRCRSTRPGSHGPEEADAILDAGPPLAGDLSERADVPDASGVWSEQDTTPGDDRGGAARAAAASSTRATRRYAPARVLNLVVVVDREWRGEIVNRLEQVGRYHPSRTILCAVEPGRTTIDASVAMTVDGEPSAGRARRSCASASMLDVGPSSTCAKLDTIVDPLVVTDLADAWCGRRTGTPRRSTRCCTWRRWC